jgi:hypothetical protein
MRASKAAAVTVVEYVKAILAFEKLTVGRKYNDGITSPIERYERENGIAPEDGYFTGSEKDFFEEHPEYRVKIKKGA